MMGLRIGDAKTFFVFLSFNFVKEVKLHKLCIAVIVLNGKTKFIFTTEHFIFTAK